MLGPFNGSTGQILDIFFQNCDQAYFNSTRVYLQLQYNPAVAVLCS